MSSNFGLSLQGKVIILGLNANERASFYKTNDDFIDCLTWGIFHRSGRDRCTKVE